MKKLAIDKELKHRCLHANAVNQENLKCILSDNANTAFGIRYGFSDIKNEWEYQNQIPLMKYDDFRSYIQKMRKGEENQLTVYPIVSYCQTSGTLGEKKYIPVSQTALTRYSDYFERYKNSVLSRNKGRRLLVNMFRTDLDRPIEPVSLFSEIYFRYLYESGQMQMDTYIGGKELVFVSEDADIMYAKVWSAFLAEDITLLESQFQYELLCFFSYMEENWQNILTDIKNGAIPENIVLGQKVREALLKMEVCEERLSKVESECKQGFENIAIRLWPRLCQVSGVSNRAYYTEGAVLKKYLGDLPRYFLCYCASECYIGAPLYENDFGYVMIPQNAFFEFLPYEEKKGIQEETKKTYLPHEVEEGGLYEPVITNFSGLYRYCLGDVVKITGFFGESPVMEFMFRKNQALNIAGEKIDIRQLEDAIRSIREKGVPIEQYYVGVCLEKVPGKYLVALSLSGDCQQTMADSEKIAALLDEALASRNTDYADLRSLKELDAPVVFLFGSKAYTAFLEAQGMKTKHGHNKPKYICPKEVSEEKWRIQQSINSKQRNTSLD